jgi:hypothetical protein
MCQKFYDYVLQTALNARFLNLILDTTENLAERNTLQHDYESLQDTEITHRG